MTHDQSDVMSFANEIVLMEDGLLQQLGTSEELFSCPQNDFIGYFIGSLLMIMTKLEPRQRELATDALSLTHQSSTESSNLLY